MSGGGYVPRVEIPDDRGHPIILVVARVFSPRHGERDDALGRVASTEKID